MQLTISLGLEQGNGPPVPVTPDANGLLAYWKLDEIEGVIAYDSFDVNNDGTVKIFDITYLINYLYRDGADPNCP